MNYLMNTLKLSIYGLLWGFPVPIILALLLNRIRRTGIKKKVQLLIYMPNFISVIVLCGMVRMLLSPVGPLNKVLGISTNWMTMPSAFRTIYIASGIWQTAGWASIMYTAALANASKELEEAAIVDGCGRFRIFAQIMLPLIKPGIVAMSIFTIKFAWNDFMWPLIVNTSMNKMTLGPALSTLQGQYTTEYPMQMAGAVLAVLPLVVMFFIFQKQFIEGVAQSGIKG